MLLSIEGMRAKLGEGMWAIDNQPRHSANWLLTKWCSISKGKGRLFSEKNFPNVKHKIKTVVSGEEFDDDEHDETGDDHATDLMSRL